MHALIKKLRLLNVLFLLLIAPAWASANPGANGIIEISRFSAMDVTGWQEKSFSGSTHYKITARNKQYVLQATADESASTFYNHVIVDLRDTPYLNWSWSIEAPLPPLNEQTQAGDDYAARIYVIIKTGIAPWQTRALNYVWSSNSAPPESWPNAFTDKAVMIPLRSGGDPIATWKMEKVNVLEDIKKYFGKNIEKIDGIAIMTDTDNSGNIAVAHYGDLFFSAN